MLHRLSREQGRFWFEDEDSILINNRQNGRRRGRGGQRTQGGGSQGSRDNGNRIDSRARGNASQLYEKYKNMASDAQRQGDRVNTEYYLQFADHYFRVLADQRGRYDDQGQAPRRSQNDFDMDDDFGDEGDPIRAEEQGRGGEDRAERDGRQNDGNRQYDGNRQQDGNRARSDRDDDQRYEGQRYEGQRADSQRGDNQRGESPRGEGQRADNQRGEGQRNDGQRNEGRRFEGNDNRPRDGQERRPRQANPRGAPRREEQAIAPVTGEALAAEAAPVETVQPRVEVQPETVVGAEAPAPKRRGRPRKAPVEAAEQQLGFDASALPPSIGSEAPAEDAPKPRRRRSIATPAEVEA
jgi:hypothetical protein